ncbi:unnamed protein product [Nippostrongylus brasiliensis]|uniref:Protein of unassigned function n=2 Tax=Nippostrongylus brasiliensis TaxID=27835 RepID=A0A0N4XST7_NIPBR|nr:unnamed protein product [Nippostrongylus brasiliensis]
MQTPVLLRYGAGSRFSDELPPVPMRRSTRGDSAARPDSDAFEDDIPRIGAGYSSFSFTLVFDMRDFTAVRAELFE